jgi:monofunctional biosynthetic peptidoglycan transglycosylase
MPDASPRKRIRWRRVIAITLLTVLLTPAVLTLIYAVVPPPFTPLMIIRAIEGEGISKDWRPLDEMAPPLARAAIAAEDNLFCSHFGFDTGAIEKAWTQYLRGSDLRGASTITMQTAKNLYLWPGRTFIRKGLEAWLTLYLETLLSKRRILELYLNIAEWAPGVYGAEAAARHHFNKGADQLTAREAALLAAVLPSPQSWDAGAPGPYVRSRADSLQRRATQLGSLTSCI